VQVHDLLGHDCVVVVCDLELNVVCRIHIVLAAIPVNALVGKHHTRVLELVVYDRHEVLFELTDDLKVELCVDLTVEDLDAVARLGGGHARQTLQQEVDFLKR
jgi:hypothetical protein